MPENVERFLDRRLEKFGLSRREVELRDLVVPRGETYFVSRLDVAEPPGRQIRDICHELAPQSWKQLKEWIGIPNEVARKLPRLPERRVSGMISADLIRDERRRAVDEVTTNVRAMAKNYLFGDSATLAQVEAILGIYYEAVIVGVVFLKDIVVGHGSTLIYGKDQKSLTAGHIKIHTGGQIRFDSDVMSVNCISIEGNLP